MDELHEMYQGRPVVKSCKAKLKVNFKKYFDNGKVAELSCCLFAPHEGTHFNPRLLLTLGGETVKAEGWSAYTY